MEKKTVCILGWYGTETLGDRAILDGILSALYLAYGECNILLGSLYPFFTERTITKMEKYIKTQHLGVILQF